MQESIRSDFIENIKKTEYLRDNKDTEDSSLKDKIIIKELDFISELQSNLSEVQLKRISKLINKSKNIICVAGRNVHAAAKWVGMSLDKVKGNTFFDEIEGESYYSNLMKVNDETLVIVISFSRYSKQSFEFTNTARKKGAFVISVTDSIVSPVAQISDEIIVVKSKVSENGFNSICPTMAIFDIIIANYLETYPKETTERLKALEEFYSENQDLYFE